MRATDQDDTYRAMRERENRFGYVLMVAGLAGAGYDVWDRSPTVLVLVFCAGLLTLGGMFVNAVAVKAWFRGALPFLRGPNG